MLFVKPAGRMVTVQRWLTGHSLEDLSMRTRPLGNGYIGNVVLLLVAKSLPSIVKMMVSYGPQVGRLIGPRSYERLYDTDQSKIPWAADNDCFSGFNEDLYLSMLNAIQLNHEGCLFVTLPDVVGDSDATLDLAYEWLPIVDETDAPTALVLQDGMKPDEIPWLRIDAVFVGGSTEWKLSHHAHELVDAAKDQGKWVHMGRVNSTIRAIYARAIGCDSIDGTGWSKFTDAMRPRWTMLEESGHQTPIVYH